MLLLLAFTVPVLGAGTILITQQSARIAGTTQQELGLGFLRADQHVVAEIRRYREDLRLKRDAESDGLEASRALDTLETRHR